MAKTPKNNLKEPWKPGQSGNPSGRPILSPEEKKIRKLSKEQFKEVGDMIVSGGILEIDDIIENPNNYTALQWLIAKALRVAGDKGDWHVVNLLLDRLIGKVKEEIDVSLPRPTVIRFKDGVELVMGAKKGDDNE